MSRTPNLLINVDSANNIADDLQAENKKLAAPLESEVRRLRKSLEDQVQRERRRVRDEMATKYRLHFKEVK